MAEIVFRHHTVSFHLFLIGLDVVLHLLPTVRITLADLVNPGMSHHAIASILTQQGQQAELSSQSSLAAQVE